MILSEVFEEEGSREVLNIPEPPRVVSPVSQKPSIVSLPDPLPSDYSMPSPNTSPLHDLDSSPAPELDLLSPSDLVSSGSDNSLTISPEVLDDLEAYSNALGSQDSRSPGLTCFEKSSDAPRSISSTLHTESHPPSRTLQQYRYRPNKTWIISWHHQDLPRSSRARIRVLDQRVRTHFHQSWIPRPYQTPPRSHLVVHKHEPTTVHRPRDHRFRIRTGGIRALLQHLQVPFRPRYTRSCHFRIPLHRT